MNQLWDSRDAKALQTWVQTRKEELQMRKERGGHIVEFLQTAHQNKLDELRREWVKEAECRLLALGYTLMKEKDLPPQKRGAWRELFHRTDPFTETKWNKLKQRVIDFLKAETNERAQRERKQRLSNRDSALCELFKSLRCEIDTLPDDPEELSAAQQVAIMVDWLPLPKYEEASKWPIMQDLLEMDVPVEEMTSQFDKRRDKFKQMMGNWGERVKQGWANALREGRKAEGLSMDPPRLRLTVGETEMDPFEGADADTNLLLRADSFFEHQDRFEICTYEELAQHFHDGSCTSWATLDSTTTHLTFSSTASAIAREFLALLKQPDASSPGLTRGWFRCGRCHTPTMDWHMSVKHYIYMARDWEKAQAHLSTFLKLGIAYNNTHDLKSVNPKDLLKQLSGQEAADVDARFKKLGKMPWIEQVAEELRPLSSNNHPTLTEGETSIGHLGTRDEGVEDGESWEEDDWDQECLTCALCRRGGLDGAMSTFATIPDMFDHLRNV
ncbi:hypothetical protein FRC09_002137 [Ceratobasidium sp. 395]|nr:hypothetical protein FRC09_002137 [Ceratobasidium sp. 395]